MRFLFFVSFFDFFVVKQVKILSVLVVFPTFLRGFCLLWIFPLFLAVFIYEEHSKNDILVAYLGHLF